MFNSLLEFCSVSLARIRDIPEVKLPQNSNTNISKQIVVTDTITLLLLKSIIFFVPSKKLTIFLCLSITPFGFPVEPEV